ncbi:hypothetical protein [Halovenus amylolytica]|uniref:hypothetical protein n=1 Tax=Halovenus amylolytica TaxID=2500550 RepID=UPI003621F950
MSVDAQQFIEEIDAPVDEPIEQLDVRNLGPPRPLSETLERLAEMDEGVLVQLNDRASQHLYPNWTTTATATKPGKRTRRR